MTAMKAPAARLLLAKLPEGGTVDLVSVADAVQSVAKAMRCRPGEAAHALADRIEAGQIEAFKLLGPNHYAEPGTDATVWRPGREGRAASSAYRTARGGFASAWSRTSDAAVSFGSVVARVAVPTPASRAVEGRAALIGPGGLASLLRAAAGSQQPATTLAGVPIAVRRDRLPSLPSAQALSGSMTQGVSGMLNMDGQRFAGRAEAEGGASMSLVYLEDVESALGKGQPRARARAAMLERLAGDAAPLFDASGSLDDFVKVVGDATAWRPTLPAGATSWREQQELPLSPYIGCMHGAEALWRGLPLHADAPEYSEYLSEQDWKALPALPELRGRAGALEAYRRVCAAAAGADRAYPDLARNVHGLAMTEHDAARLWPELAANVRSFWEGESEPSRAALGRVSAGVVRVAATHLVQVSDAEPDAAATVVKPDGGGTWPHLKGAWTDAERAAAFLMRHKHKVSDDDLVRIIGVSRQAINAQIGGSHRTVSRTKVPAWPTVWHPSAELLKECGLALQPLQVMAATAG